MKYLLLTIIAVFVLFLTTSCGDGDNGDDGNNIACLSTNNDSEETPTGWNPIRSENSGIYGNVTLTRETLGSAGSTITMDYIPVVL